MWRQEEWRKRVTFWSEILQAAKLVEAGSRRHSTTLFRDLLKALVSLLCSVYLRAYYSCSVRNREDFSGNPKLVGS